MSAIQRRAVVFADLRGSTALYELLGNTDASQIVTETVGAIARRVPATGGVVVKTLGDGLMAVFPTAAQAVEAADQMHEEIDIVMRRRDALTGFTEARLQLQVCIALGETVEVSGDYFGDAVNVAARLLDHAGDNETLVTVEVLRALPMDSRDMFRSLDLVRLRGRVEPVEVHLLSRRGMDTAPTLVGAGPAMGLVGPEAVVLTWGNKVRRFTAFDMPVVIGRAAASDMQVDDARVSRSHCRIDLIGATLQLSDLSINGTFVRFSSEDEVVSLRRGSCTLHGSGEVGLSGSPEDPGVAAMQFEVLHAPIRRDDEFDLLSPTPVAAMSALPRERAHAHDAADKVGILLVNLGTPEAPTKPALRRYLAQFLSDPRVVEIPRALWWLILHGVILRVRPAASARKYKKIWLREGSPLAVWTARQANMLKSYVGERGAMVEVRWAMRYGQPAIAAELDALCADGATRILVLPAYPQYSAATTASVLDDVGDWMKRTRRLPELRFVNHYHDDPGYIDALAAQVRKHWQREGRGRKLVMSFHGMPARTLALGDPYHCECLKTGRLLAEKLQLEPDAWRVTFQSRFGRAEWLQPYTEPTLKALAKAGDEGVDVICPGFASDCLETLEEIAIEARAAFLKAGGKAFHYIPCLNNSPEGMKAMAGVALRHLQGWDTTPMSKEALKQRQARAIAHGASE